MTTIDVHDETGTNSQLRAQIADILSRVVPLVEPLTGLDLPGRVTFRIVPPQTWQAEQRGDLVQRMRRFQNLQPLWKQPLIGLQSLMVIGLFRWASPTLGEVLVMGATQPKGGGDESQTLLVPQALQHNGVLSDLKYLTQLVVHELMHQAANFMNRHRGPWVADRPEVLIRQGNVDVLEEGHAHWADQVMSQAEFGTACDVFSAPKSERYKKIASHPLFGLLRPKTDPYAVGRVLVASAIDTVGPRAFNRVWTDARLLPTDAEVAEAAEALAADPPTQPQLWANRLQDTAVTTPGSHPSPSA
ncbi:zinc-dependent metalloprotease (plasmid) [Streptomyces globisporus]|uniref:hypothetical protein n=1 Tax=Streptomyces globisporus TaxID=1908 RepID=UPI002F918489|nr:zinc-dependent metalloprotease [Streptomyces globisporus]